MAFTSNRMDQEASGLKDKVVFINRVAKVVKGGRRFSFSALVVVGDGMGSVGMGKGKANEVPEAIRKAVDKARKSMVTFPLKDGTIPHKITGKYGGGTVIMNPAVKGTGLIAGGAVRAIMEVGGVVDINAKALGGHNPFNTIRATLDGLMKLKDPEKVLRLRGKLSDDSDAQQADEAPEDAQAAEETASA